MSEPTQTETPTKDAEPPVDSATSDEKKEKETLVSKLRVLDHWWSVLILLFGFTGFLGIPILWHSRSYNVTMKIVITILVIIYSCVLLYILHFFLNLLYEEVMRALEV